MQQITNAFLIALHQHQGISRKYNGHPYIVHPVRVALAVSHHTQAQPFWIAGAFLHDTLEDTVDTPQKSADLKHRIATECGKDVLQLVEELTNEEHAKSIRRRRRKELDWERLAKVSREAKIIKMLDRIDNLGDMLGALVDFKKLYCEESQELLKVLCDADPDLAQQLKTAIENCHL